MNTNLQAMSNIRKSAEEKLKANRDKAVATGLDETQKAIEDYQKALLRSGFWRSCLNCGLWNDPKTPEQTRSGSADPIYPEGCLKFRMMPPVNIIVHGCRDWQDDIPF